MTNDDLLFQLHPSVTSRIFDEGVVYITAQGLTTLYAAFPAERGPDNRPVLITTESEFNYVYGAPNMRRFGQTAYNVVNWLTHGGQVVCTRILPYMAPTASLPTLQAATYPLYILELGIDLLNDNIFAGDPLVDTGDTYKPWVSRGTVADGDVIYWDNRYYSVTGDGELHVNPPTHKTGTAVSGEVTLTAVAAPARKLKIRIRNPGDFARINFNETTFRAQYLVANPGALEPEIAAAVVVARRSATLDRVNLELAARDDATIRQQLVDGAYSQSGFKWHPLLALRPNSRGEYYNGHGFRFELFDSEDETYDFRLYRLEFYSKYGQVLENFVVSLYPDAVDISGNSMFIVDVLKRYSSTLTCIYNEDNWDAVATLVNNDPSRTKKLDLLFLEPRNISVPEDLLNGWVFAAGSHSPAPTNKTAWTVGTGRDGLWTGPNSLASMLTAAYTGTGDSIDPVTGKNLHDTYFSDILNKATYPIDVVLDANYPTSVKNAMADFCATRGDAVAILDCGFTGSPTQAIAFRSVSLGINTFFASIFCQDFVIYDPSTGSDIRVTPTYYLAQKIPLVDKEFGIQWPFVGPRRGTLSGYKSLSWNPNEAQREMLWKSQLNYVQQDLDQTAFMGEQTSQRVTSPLSDLSHVRVLLRIRRDTMNEARSYLFEFNDAQTREALQYSLNNSLQLWVSNRALSWVEARVYASDYDVQRGLFRVRVDLRFTGIVKRISIDLVVNR